LRSVEAAKRHGLDHARRPAHTEKQRRRQQREKHRDGARPPLHGRHRRDVLRAAQRVDDASAHRGNVERDGRGHRDRGSSRQFDQQRRR
jgi:hypothetical protein